MNPWFDSAPVDPEPDPGTPIYDQLKREQEAEQR